MPIPAMTRFLPLDVEYTCPCGERLNQSELDHYTSEHLEHRAPVYCGFCRSCAVCLLPTLTDDDLNNGIDTCASCPEPTEDW